MTPLISIVTGTFQRRRFLANMIGSVRANVPLGIEYEVVIVDGGSTDGTLEWCRQQKDVRLIEQGELLGAIRAFCDGAKAAQGEYVLLANDDINLLPGSIMAALTHMERYPNCGGVGFADNRAAPGYETGFKVQTITVRTPDGHEQNAVYAQVGLFRRWLGDLAGWWGADEPGFNGHTYGGDSFLSARIWEMGYTIDVVDECKVLDHVPNDDLRKRNTETEERNPGWYYRRYPQPPIVNSQKIRRIETPERLRTLYLPIYDKGYGKYKRGLREALARYGLVYEVDYNNETYDLEKIVHRFQPHLLLMQAHSANSIPLEKLVAARKVRPDMVVVNWNGDVHQRGLIDEAMLIYLRHIDLQLTVNASALDAYRQHNLKAAYWQIGFEPVDDLPDMPVHDVVFLATGYSVQRRALGAALQSLPGVNVGLYGGDWQWGNGNTLYNFPAGAALYRQAKIAVGDNQYGDQYGFVSNRLFEALGNGAFLLHQTIPGLQELTGITAGVHYVEWTDLSDLQDKIRYYLNPRHKAKREAIARAGEAFAREHHSFDARVKELFTTLLPLIEDEPTLEFT